MISRLGGTLSRVSAKLVPDPFVLALGLTAIVSAIAFVRVISEPTAVESMSSTAALEQVLTGWLEGFTSPAGLAFALQMSLVLVTGHALALSPPVQSMIRGLTRIVIQRGMGTAATARAALVVASVACGSAVIHWGLGAIVGAFLAREIGRHAERHGIAIHFPLLGAAAYAGLALWHGGLSGSAPLKAAEAGNFMERVADGPVPVAETLLSPLNLAITGGLLLLIPALFFWLAPRAEDEIVTARDLGPARNEEKPPIDSVPTFLQESRAIGVTTGVIGLLIVLGSYLNGALSFDLNTVNLIFLFFGIACQMRLRSYVEAIADGARGAGAIVLQFPFYFGILGMMKASGMIQWISDGLVSISSATTFPLFAFLSAGVINLLVPSGGGQWAVQGEVLLTAGAAHGVAPGVTIMAFAYGDAWTNMLQPFWALPLLGIMGLRARDIVGYSAVVFLAMGILVPLLLLLLA